MIDGLEFVSSLIARFAKMEDVYLGGDSIDRQHLMGSIVELYTAILIYLTEAKCYQGLKRGGCTLESPSVQSKLTS